MSKVLKGSFELMKQLNIAAILNVLRTKEKMSRAEIALITGLTPASITNITKFLLKAGYLNETGIGESNGGRPPVILELNPEARYTIGVNLNVGIIEVVAANLNANIIAKKTIEVADKEDEKKYVVVLNQIISMINGIIYENNIQKDKITGIGMAVHGVANASTGILEFSPYYNWRNVPIAYDIENAIGYSVFIDNDVRAMALGESWFGSAKGVDNFITINISNGIGAGIIIDNKPYYGVNHSSGEIGHIVVDPDGPKCCCGNYGCLESIASNKSLVKKSIKLIKQGTETSILKEKRDIQNITIEDICDAANNGDEAAIMLLKESGRYIGLVISNLVNILNPTEIVMVGETMTSNDYALESIKTTVKNVGFMVPSQNVKIVQSALGNNAAAVGAVTLVLEEIFNGREFAEGNN
ncbi:MAG: ROK family transcriptional regulator [Bacillota bacterium]|nr:ROK family transcriptional regulator [Bacillota bacterium]